MRDRLKIVLGFDYGIKTCSTLFIRLTNTGRLRQFRVKNTPLAKHEKLHKHLGIKFLAKTTQNKGYSQQIDVYNFRIAGLLFINK